MFDLVSETWSISSGEDWWVDSNDFDINSNGWEADLNLRDAGAVVFVHIIEPVGSIKSEKWLDIMINNHDILAIMVIILNKNDAWFDLLNDAVQVVDTLLNGFQLDWVIIGLALKFVYFDFNWWNLLADGIRPGDWFVVFSLKGLQVNFEFQVWGLDGCAVGVDTVDYGDQLGDESLDFSNSNFFSFGF